MSFLSDLATVAAIGTAAYFGGAAIFAGGASTGAAAATGLTASQAGALGTVLASTALQGYGAYQQAQANQSLSEWQADMYAQQYAAGLALAASNEAVRRKKARAAMGEKRAAIGMSGVEATGSTLASLLQSAFQEEENIGLLRQQELIYAQQSDIQSRASSYEAESYGQQATGAIMTTLLNMGTQSKAMGAR